MLRTIIVLAFLNITIFLSAQFSEELIKINYEANTMTSIKVYENIPYIDQLQGGVAINTDNNLYTFTGQGGDTKLYTADIASGDILFEVDVPQIQMIQFRPGSENLVGISKGNPSGEVALGWVNYKTGDNGTYTAIPELQDITIETHNSAIDTDLDIFYFVGSLAGTNDWSIISINASTGDLINHFPITPSGQAINAIAFDQQRKLLLGILSVTPDVKSLVSIDPATMNITQIKEIPGYVSSFGGHRYWAYDDAGDKFFVIALDVSNDSFLYVLDSSTGAVLFKNPYPDEVWIMEEHSPLEIRYSPNTQQLLGLRKGEPLAPVGIFSLENLSNDLTIFPNPTSNQQITVELENDESILSFSIFSANGKLMLEKNNILTNSFDLSTKEYSAGLYFIVCHSQNGIHRQSFVIK